MVNGGPWEAVFKANFCGRIASLMIGPNGRYGRLRILAAISFRMVWHDGDVSVRGKKYKAVKKRGGYAVRGIFESG